MLKILSLRKKLGKLKGKLVYMAASSTPKGGFHIIKVKSLGFATVEVDYYSDDMETWLKSGTLYIGDIVELTDVAPLNLFRHKLLKSNPDLCALTEGYESPFDDVCEHFEDDDEWQ